MTEITSVVAVAKIACHFADQLNRFRALTSDEVRMLERALSPTVDRDTRRPWTIADDVELAKLRHQGKKAPEIATALGRTPWAVRSRVCRLNRIGGAPPLLDAAA